VVVERLGERGRNRWRSQDKIRQKLCLKGGERERGRKNNGEEGGGRERSNERRGREGVGMAW
jgi:hypothetical protein